MGLHKQSSKQKYIRIVDKLTEMGAEGGGGPHRIDNLSIELSFEPAY